jgi:hypothetical protein
VDGLLIKHLIEDGYTNLTPSEAIDIAIRGPRRAKRR